LPGYRATNLNHQMAETASVRRASPPPHLPNTVRGLGRRIAICAWVGTAEQLRKWALRAVTECIADGHDTALFCGGLYLAPREVLAYFPSDMANKSLLEPMLGCIGQLRTNGHILSVSFPLSGAYQLYPSSATVVVYHGLAATRIGGLVEDVFPRLHVSAVETMYITICRRHYDDAMRSLLHDMGAVVTVLGEEPEGSDGE